MSLFGRFMRRRNSTSVDDQECERRSVVSEAVSTSSIASFIKPRSRLLSGLSKAPLPEEKRVELFKRNSQFNRSEAFSEQQRLALLRSICKDGIRALNRLSSAHEPDGGDSNRIACLRLGIILDENCPAKSRLATEEEMKELEMAQIDDTYAEVCKVCKQKTVGLTRGGTMYVCMRCGVDHGVVSVSLAYAGNKTHEEGMLTARGDVVNPDAGKDDLPATSVEEARNHVKKSSQEVYHGVPKDLVHLQRSLERQAMTATIAETDPLLVELAPINNYAQKILTDGRIRMHAIGEANGNALLHLINADLRRLCNHQEMCTKKECGLRMIDVKTPMLKLVVKIIILDWLDVFYNALKKKEAMVRNHQDTTSLTVLSKLIPDVKQRHYMSDQNLRLYNSSVQSKTIDNMIKNLVRFELNNDPMTLINMIHKGPIMTVLTMLRKHGVPSCCSDEITHDLIICPKEHLDTASIERLQEALQIAKKMKIEAELRQTLCKMECQKVDEAYKRINECIKVLTNTATSSNDVPMLKTQATQIRDKANQLQRNLLHCESEVVRFQERYNLINLALWNKDANDTSSLLDVCQLHSDVVEHNLFAIAEAADALSVCKPSEFDYTVPCNEASKMVAEMTFAAHSRMSEIHRLHQSSPIGSTHGPLSPPTQTNQYEPSQSPCTAMDLSPMGRELGELPRPSSAMSQRSTGSEASPLMPPPPPKPRKQRMASQNGQAAESAESAEPSSSAHVTSSPLKRSRSLSVEGRPLSESGLVLQASLNNVREKMGAPTATTPSSINTSALANYRDPAMDASSVGSSEHIPPAVPFGRVASTGSVASSCESFATAVSTISIRTLELPTGDEEASVVQTLQQAATFASCWINSFPALKSINHANSYNAFLLFRKSDEAKAIFYALQRMNNSENTLLTTFHAAYVFFGIVFSYRRGFLALDSENSTVGMLSPSKRTKTNEGLVAVVSYEVAFNQALKWKNTLNQRLPFFGSKVYRDFEAAAKNARLM